MGTTRAGSSPAFRTTRTWKIEKGPEAGALFFILLQGAFPLILIPAYHFAGRDFSRLGAIKKGKEVYEQHEVQARFD